MTIEDLQTLYKYNINSIFTPSNFKNIASHSNNIQGYSFINRSLIYIQNRYCTDVKSEESWLIDGRTVKAEAIPMGVMVQSYKTKYIDTETKKEIRLTELTALEFNKGIALGIFEKQTIPQDIQCTYVYDIRDLNSLPEGNQEESNGLHRKIKLSSLLELVISLGISVSKEELDKSSFDIESNTLRLGQDNITDKVESVIYTVLVYCRDTLNIDSLKNEDYFKICKDYILYGVFTYFGIDTGIDIEFNYIDMINDLSTEEQTNVTELLDFAENMMNTCIISAESSEKLDETYKTRIINKASILLSVLEANYEMASIRGGVVHGN